MRPLTIDIRQVQACLGIGKTLAYQLIRDGELTKVAIRGRTLVTYDSIEKFVARHSIKGDG